MTRPVKLGLQNPVDLLLRLPFAERLGLTRRKRDITRFLKFAIVGAFGMVVDLTVLNVLVQWVLPALLPNTEVATRLVISNSVSFSVAVLSNFTWNRLWTFPESRQRPLLSQLGQFALVNVIGLAINDGILWVVFQLISGRIPPPFDYNAAKVVAIGVVLFWNYGVNRAWTYRGIR